ncbi:MAG: leucine-rich repeat domain-containing protein, partial [Muribaculaceae bacterium]|nr:leucine-rich repeat domain-containing protein [Muribaculaceae bacterium]
MNGESIRKLTIPEGTKKLNSYAFYNCEPLLTVTFPESIEVLEDYVFYGCSGLQRAIFPDTYTYLGLKYTSDYAKIDYDNKCKIYIGSEEYDPEIITWPESLTVVPAYAFYENNVIRKINLPETVTEIGEYAFYECRNLTDIIIPGNVREIKKSTFEECRSLTSVTISGPLVAIGEYAFEECTNLTSINIPYSVTSIGAYAFYACRKLTSLDMENPNCWSQIDFYDEMSNPVTYTRKFTVNGSDVRHLDLDIPGRSVSDYAFYNARNLNTVRIKGEGVGEDAFEKCSALIDLCLDVKSLGSYAFEDCTAIKTIYCMTPEPPEAPDNAFGNYTDVTLYVPRGSMSKYENAETCWWRFLDIIETDFAGIDSIFRADYISSGEISGIDRVDNSYTATDYTGRIEVFN